MTLVKLESLLHMFIGLLSSTLETFGPTIKHDAYLLIEFACDNVHYRAASQRERWISSR
jgi:hypothetical protein